MTGDVVKASILMAAYNEEKYICEAIDSCLNQTHSDVEVVITNDGSTDDTLPLIKKKYGHLPNVKIHTFIKNEGKVAAFNHCFNNSAGDYVFLMGADDISLPERVSRSLQELQTRNLEFICGDLIKFSDDRIISKSMMSESFHVNQNSEFYFDSLLRRPKVAGGTIAMKRSLAEKIFPLPEILKHEDWWIPLVAAIHSSVSYIHIPMLKYRIHDNNESETNLIHAEFSNWQSRTQMRKIIHYRLVLNTFKLTSGQQNFVRGKRLIHVLLHESNTVKRFKIFKKHFKAYYLRTLTVRDGCKLCAAVLSPLLSFYLPKLYLTAKGKGIAFISKQRNVNALPENHF